MNKIILFFIVVTILPMNINAETRFATIDGFCFLENAETHEGTKVLFTAVTPSAETDSTYTNDDGNYLIELSEGIYTVTYEHDGWQPYTIEDDVICFNNITLDDITLSFGNIVNVAGNQNGTWQYGNIFHVTGDVTIADGDSLLIEPGVTVQFMGYYSIFVDGILLSEGTIQDSITFESGQTEKNPGDWDMIKFNQLAENESVISYCKISHAHFGVYINTSCPTIIENNITYNEMGIGCITTTNSLLENNKISNNLDYGICVFDCSPYISENFIENNDRGIHCGQNSDPYITNNIILENNIGIFSDYAAPEICDNIISNNIEGIVLNHTFSSITKNLINNNIDNGIRCFNESTVNIRNNSVNNNNIGINNLESILSINDNIIYSNTTGIITDNNNYTLSYDLFWQNSLNITEQYQLLYFNEIITVNVNGDSCDTYMNLFMDPLLVDPENGDYTLTEESPCIDAGNPDPEYYDPDGTIADIGALYYFQSGYDHIYGDIDDNGEIEAFDASLALQYFCLLVPEGTTLPWEDWRIEVADVDDNGVVEAFDAALIMQYAIGYINSFPVENR